jgi:hypothetical protein
MLSGHIAKYMGGLNPATYPKEQYRWTIIRPYAKLEHIGRWLSAYIFF